MQRMTIDTRLGEVPVSIASGTNLFTVTTEPPILGFFAARQNFLLISVLTLS